VNSLLMIVYVLQPYGWLLCDILQESGGYPGLQGQHGKEVA
jgi:hypothetical protein